MADEVIDEVRRVRHEISRRCGHDAHQVVAWYRAFQEGLKRSGKYRFFEGRNRPCSPQLLALQALRTSGWVAKKVDLL